MILLAIDTATRILSVALHDGRNLLAEHTWRTDNNHTAELAPALQHMLDSCGLAVTDLGALAVSIGPGSYTGLRIGVSLAKGLASMGARPLVGVSTLDTLAAGQPYYQGHGLVVTVEAGRGRIITATYRWSKGRWVARGEPQLMTWEQLLESIDGPAYITGDLDADAEALIAETQGREVPVKVVPAVYRLRRAGFLAEEALARLGDGSAHNAAQLAPIYIQTKDTPN